MEDHRTHEIFVLQSLGEHIIIFFLSLNTEHVG